MGNQLCLGNCYYEDHVLPQERIHQIPQDFQGINTLFQYQSCEFCRIQLNFLIQSNFANKQQYDNDLFLNYKKNSHHFIRAPWNSPVFNQSETQFSQPTAFLHNDRIHEITTSWFQLYLAQPKYQKETQNCAPGSADYKYIIQGEILQKKVPTAKDILTLYALRWVVVEYFTGAKSLNSEEALLSEGVCLYETIAHICRLYRNILLFYKMDEELIVIYSKLWKKYVEIMESVMQYYDQLQDQIQIVYGYWESQGHFKQFSKEKIPHLKLIGVMARFWCQIVGKQFDWYLKRSFWFIYTEKHFDKQQEMKRFINDIIDISFNEIDIHWIGNSQRSHLNKLLKNILYFINDERIKYLDQLVSSFQNDEEYVYDQIIMYLKKEIQIYPTWLYDLYIEQPTIQYMLHYLQDKLSKSGLIKISTVSTKDSLDKLQQFSAIRKQIDESYEKVSLEQVIQTNLVINQDKDSLMAHFIDKIKETKISLPSSKFYSSSKIFQGKKQSIQDSSIFSTNCSLHPSAHSLEISKKEISYSTKTLLSNINSLNVKLMERIILRDTLLEDRVLFKKIPQDRYIRELDFYLDDIKYINRNEMYDIDDFLIGNLICQQNISQNQNKIDKIQQKIDRLKRINKQ